MSSARTSSSEEEIVEGTAVTRTVTLEEHFVTQPFIKGPGREMHRLLGVFARSAVQTTASALMDQLLNLGESRISEMDQAGIDVQVLSLTRGFESVMEESEAIKSARESNDILGDAVKGFPTRFGGFTALPVLVPEKAADELERTSKEYGFKGAMIHGHARGRYLDDKFFWPIFERAEELGVPIYLHPTPPPEAVIKANYIGNYSQEVAALLSIAGWGWHIETGLHTLRIILSSAFDKYPKLQLIIGHLGEGLPFFMQRLESIFPTRLTKLNHPIGTYLRENVHYTVSGFNNLPAFLDLFLRVGADRIMFSADYPFGSMKEARKFLNELPISPNEKEDIAHRNAENLLKL
jgi:predicted TIM-barrel fold metal-dependent hydrolase